MILPEVMEVDGVPTVTAYAVNQEAWGAFLASIPDEPEPDVEELRAAKAKEISAECSAAIYAGVDVGESHYSLTEHDQTELLAQTQAVKEGAPAVPYHADGELCRMYPAEEFTALAQAAYAHVFYHRTYCNHAFAWIARADLAELDSIKYGAELPADLAERMAAIIAAAGGSEDDAV